MRHIREALKNLSDSLRDVANARQEYNKAITTAKKSPRN